MSTKQDMLKTLKSYLKDKDCSREAYTSYADRPFSISMINKYFKKYPKMLEELKRFSSKKKVKTKVSVSDSFEASVKQKGADSE